MSKKEKLICLLEIALELLKEEEPEDVKSDVFDEMDETIESFFKKWIIDESEEEQ